MTLRKLHSTAPHGSARCADYHIKFERGRYSIYDKQQRFRCAFATLPAAQAYIDQRSGAASHNNALSDERQAVAA